MIRQELKNILENIFPDEKIVVDYVPRGKQGDYSTNLAFMIAARKGIAPKKAAEQLAAKIKDPMIASVIVHEPAFINFTISRDYLLNELFKNDKNLNLGQEETILVEYVSSNPTGPIVIVSARAAAVGDSLVRLLNRTGFKALAEYYINDGGRQSYLLAESVRQRMNEIRGEKAEIPKNGYHGEYITGLAKEIISEGIEDIEEIKTYAFNYFIEGQKKTLKDFGVVFDNWVRESDIYERGYVDEILNILKDKNLTYTKDKALFFKTTDFGDDKDRVIVTSDKHHTYLLPDIAYHHDKLKRNHDSLINIWGPDHHGRIKGLSGGIRALGYPENILKILIVQQVRLKKAGKLIKMSKRAGAIATLNELLEHVPKDVVRFFFLMRASSQHLDFDLDLALKESDENPVYYVQYAHARIKSIMRFAKESGIESTDDFDPSNIKEPEEIELVKYIVRFPEILEDAVRNLEPYIISYYLIELARAFHYFYHKHQVVGDNKVLSKARLALVKRTAETLKSGLDILGVSCPERM